MNQEVKCIQMARIGESYRCRHHSAATSNTVSQDLPTADQAAMEITSPSSRHDNIADHSELHSQDPHTPLTQLHAGDSSPYTAVTICASPHVGTNHSRKRARLVFDTPVKRKLARLTGSGSPAV